MLREKRPLLLATPWTRTERVLMVLATILGISCFAMIARAEDPRVQLGLVPSEVMDGSRLFFRETFNGNGRTCGSCHPAESNFTLSAMEVATLADDDPFFATSVPGLERPELLRSHALILENVDGFDQEPKFRAIQHVLSLATSIHSGDPDDHAVGENTVGWSADGAPGAGSLRDFATGAVIQHLTRSVERVPGRDFRLPTDEELDALLAFQLTLGRTRDLDIASARMADSAAERGRLMMLDFDPVNCGRCHANGGANRGRPNELHLLNQSKDTNVDALRVPGLPHDDGRGTPGDEQFSPPPIIEAADTGPFFHTNTIADLEGAIRFYTTPVFSGATQTFGEAGVQDLGAVLRVLNAALNAQMACQRLEAARQVEASFPEDPVVEDLLRFASEESLDGEMVMAKLDPRIAATFKRGAHNALKAVEKGKQRDSRIAKAIADCEEILPLLGTGLEMALGVGNLAVLPE